MRCDYCHAEEGEPHAVNCWAPDGIHAGEIVIPRSDIAMLIEDNEGLRARITELEGTLEAVIHQPHTLKISVAQDIARAALSQEKK